MSCTSPLTVASRIVARVAWSATVMCGSRCVTAAFITSADWRTSATIIWLSPKRRPTSSIPFISGPLTMSSGFRVFRSSSRSARRPSIEPSTTFFATRSRIGSFSRSEALFSTTLTARKWAEKAATASKRRGGGRPGPSTRGRPRPASSLSDLGVAGQLLGADDGKSRPASTHDAEDRVQHLAPAGGSPKEFEMPNTLHLGMPFINRTLMEYLTADPKSQARAQLRPAGRR